MAAVSYNRASAERRKGELSKAGLNSCFWHGVKTTEPFATSRRLTWQQGGQSLVGVSIRTRTPPTFTAIISAAITAPGVFDLAD